MDIANIDGKQLITIPSSRMDRVFILNHHGDYISDYLRGLRYWEISLIDRISYYLKPGDHVLDIGGHLGTWSIAMARLIAGKNMKGQQGRVDVFEPQKGLYNRICGSIALSRCDDLVYPHNVAVGSNEQDKEILHLAIPNPQNTGACKMAILEEHLGRKDYPQGEGGGPDSVHRNIQGERCLVRSLDSFFSEPLQADTGKVNFIKMDVEGFEINVLRGSLNFLKENGYPTILFECWDFEYFEQQRKELMDYFREIGYKHIIHLQYNDFLAIYDDSRLGPNAGKYLYEKMLNYRNTNQLALACELGRKFIQEHGSNSAITNEEISKILDEYFICAYYHDPTHQEALAVAQYYNILLKEHPGFIDAFRANEGHIRSNFRFVSNDVLTNV